MLGHSLDTALPPDIAQAAAQHSPAPLLALDAAGLIRYANPAALALLGHSEAHVVGRPFLDTLDGGSRTKGQALLEAARAGPTPVYELNHQVAGDQPMVLIGYHAVPLSDAATSNGQPGTLLIGQSLGAVVAVTERLIASNQRLSALFRIAAVVARAFAPPEALARALAAALEELDLRAGALFVSEAPVATSQTQRSPEQLELAAQQGMAPALLERLPEHMVALAGGRLAPDRPFIIEGNADDLGIAPDDLLAPSGPLLSLAAIPLLSENRLMGWLYVVSDRYRGLGAHELDTLATIGQLLGPLVEHAQIDRIKDEFVAAAAHDLKTPVTAVKGYAQIALRLARRLDQPRLSQQLEMINARSDDLAYLMEALLDMSRIQAGRLHLEVETFPVSDLIAAAVAHFDFDLKRQGRTIALELPDDPAIVSWDRTRIERALINLLNNALKYSPGAPSIALQVRVVDATDELELAVTDAGIGVPQHERELIFERFYRARQTIQDGFKGTGIGLYISRNVVELHGGRIWAEDARHGGPGLTVCMRLPRAVAASDMV